jgi:hypothetical protein
MTDPRTQAILQGALVRESRSLLQYAGDSFPWTTAGENAALPEVRRLIDEQLQGAEELARFLTRHRVPLPYLGQYPMAFTEVNYISLDHLLSLLAEDERGGLAALEAGQTGLHDPEAHAQLARLIQRKRDRLATLEKLAAAHPEPAGH